MSTVLLSRPPSSADRLITLLEDLGHTVINAPVTTIEALSVPQQHSLDPIAGSIVSSAAAVPHIPKELADSLKSKPALAVGPTTATALTQAGWRDVQHFGGEMLALLAALAQRFEAGPWAYPCGAQLAHAPEDMARQTGASIVPIPVYEARTCGPWPAPTVAALQSQAIDVTLFLSVRSAKLFIENVRAAQLWPQGAPGAAGCISQAVAEAIAPLSYKERVVSQEKTTSSLVAAMRLS
ncbi:MAG: uroporphyrinogen-III synthase [Pseudomonadota bacterium]